MAENPEGSPARAQRRALGLAAAPGLRRWGAAWRVARRRVERLRELIEGWAPAVETEAVSESPDWQRRRREMEARALRVESALRELEVRQGALGADWDRSLAELERVYEGWRLLREEVGVSPQPLSEGTVWDLEAKTARLSALWEHLNRQQVEAARESARLAKTWRWLLAVSLPSLEAKAAGTPEAGFLPALRRRLEDLDRRWKESGDDVRRAATDEALSGLRAELDAAKARGEALEAELASLKEARAAAPPAPSLAAELRATQLGLGEAVAALEAARQEKEYLKASYAQAMDYLWSKLQRAETRLAELGMAPAAAAASPAPLAPPPAPLPPPPPPPAVFPAPEPAAALPMAPLEDDEGNPAIPSVEPVLDPGWTRVLASLRGPIGAAYAHLRRLSAGAMPEGYRAVLKMAAASIAQASDLLKVVEDYLDDTTAAPAMGRLEPVLESALAAWEPALRARHVAVDRRIDANLPTALHSPSALRLAFYQIIRNAYEAMPRGGTFTIKAWKDETGAARVSFQDTGLGFSDKALADAFKPFASSRAGHLGLGLALARRIVRRAHGEVEAVNVKQPVGALVTVRLAASLDEPPPLPSVKTPGK